MPVEPTESLLQRLGFKFPEQVELTSEQLAEMDRRANEQQAKDPIWKQYLRKGIETGTDSLIGAFKGLTGSEFTPGAPTTEDKANAITQLAALPMAVPRRLQASLFRNLTDFRNNLNLSKSYRNLITNWSSGDAMFNPTKNLEFANNLRNSGDISEDIKTLQKYLSQALDTDKIPLYRGTRNPNVIDDLFNHYKSGTDPGIRSFSMEPKSTYHFAGNNAPLVYRHNDTDPIRATKGSIFKVDAPIESILGYGEIPEQRELIVDLSKLGPQNIKPMRIHENPMWTPYLKDR